MVKMIKIESDTVEGKFYNVKMLNGSAVSCSCAGFTGSGRCKHLERADLMFNFLRAKFLFSRNFGKEWFNNRFNITLEKHKSSKNPVATSMRRTISAAGDHFTDEMTVERNCTRCGGYGVIFNCINVKEGICYRCNGSGIVEPEPPHNDYCELGPFK